MTEQNKSTENKPKAFASESEREVAVCIAIQKLGRASVQEIVEKIEKWNGKITEKQVSSITEKLRSRDLISIDLSEKDDTGVSIKRYLMRKIKLAIPEVAQIKDLVDDPLVNELKDELERSKGTRKKGLKTFDYYKVEVAFEISGNVQGFVPDSKGVLMHYRENNEIVFYNYHFKNWLRANLPLINRTSSSIGDISFQHGKVILGKNKPFIQERYVTNIESGFSSSRGTGGRGTRSVECLPHDCKVVTIFSIPRELIKPEKIELAFKVICENGSAFGGNSKLSTGKLINPVVKVLDNAIWNDD